MSDREVVAVVRRGGEELSRLADNTSSAGIQQRIQLELQTLLNDGHNINYITDHGYTALRYAVKFNFDAVREFLLSHPSIDSSRILMYAIEYGNDNLIQRFRLGDWFTKKALHFALYQAAISNWELYDSLLAQWFLKENAQDSEQRSRILSEILHTICKGRWALGPHYDGRRQMECIKHLLEQYPEIDVNATVDGYTPLAALMVFNNGETSMGAVLYLLNNTEADPNICCPRGENMFEVAVDSWFRITGDRRELFNILLERTHNNSIFSSASIHDEAEDDDGDASEEQDEPSNYSNEEQSSHEPEPPVSESKSCEEHRSIGDTKAIKLSRNLTIFSLGILLLYMLSKR